MKIEIFWENTLKRVAQVTEQAAKERNSQVNQQCIRLLKWFFAQSSSNDQSQVVARTQFNTKLFCNAQSARYTTS